MLAMAWLLHESTTRRGAELGLTAEGMGGYAVGRLGVLGDCPIDNVVGAAYFWEPATMTAMVEAAFRKYTLPCRTPPMPPQKTLAARRSGG